MPTALYAAGYRAAADFLAGFDWEAYKRRFRPLAPVTSGSEAGR